MSVVTLVNAVSMKPPKTKPTWGGLVMELDKVQMSSVDHSLRNKALGLCGFHCFKNVGNSKKQFAWLHVFSLGELSPHLHPTVKDRGSCNCLFSLSVSVSGRILDLKTGTVKKEGQQSSMRMCMGSRRSFICRMRSVWGSSGLGLWWGYSLPLCC